MNKGWTSPFAYGPQDIPVFELATGSVDIDIDAALLNAMSADELAASAVAYFRRKSKSFADRVGWAMCGIGLVLMAARWLRDPSPVISSQPDQTVVFLQLKWAIEDSSLLRPGIVQLIIGPFCDALYAGEPMPTESVLDLFVEFARLAALRSEVRS